MPSSTKCRDTRDPFTDAPCERDATARVWSDAPGHELPFEVCDEHARLFARMIAKYCPGHTAHAEPLVTAGTT